MKTAIRSTFLAALLAVSAAGASAATVTLDFEVLGKQALGDPANGVPASPVLVGDKVKGFSLSGAYAYEFDMLDSRDLSPGDNTNQGGFIINRDRNMVTAPIVLALDSGVYPARYFTGIQFEVFTTSDKPQIFAFDSMGASQLVSDLTPGNGDKFWSLTAEYKIDPLFQATRLEFTTDGGVIGLDNIAITLSAATDPNNGGGTVPEPASYALVGLALLAAGAASRRKA